MIRYGHIHFGMDALASEFYNTMNQMTWQLSKMRVKKILKSIEFHSKSGNNSDRWVWMISKLYSKLTSPLKLILREYRTNSKQFCQIHINININTCRLNHVLALSFARLLHSLTAIIIFHGLRFVVHYSQTYVSNIS